MTSRLRAAALCAALPLALAGCGVGDGNSGPTVSNMAATNVAYSRTMTITVNGSGLTDGGLQMQVEGPCDNVTRAANPADFQTVYTCSVNSIGPITAKVRSAEGTELARLNVSVPSPQVTIVARQGTLSGSIVIELDPVAAPITARNFMAYVATGFYTNTIFHRVREGELVQGGGFTTGPVAKTATLPAIALESNNGLLNLRGTIGMARGEAANSATSQFFFNLADNPAFDRVGDIRQGYAVFGKVISGQDVLDLIGGVPVQSLSLSLEDVPITDIVITSMTQTR